MTYQKRAWILKQMLNTANEAAPTFARANGGVFREVVRTARAELGAKVTDAILKPYQYPTRHPETKRMVPMIHAEGLACVCFDLTAAITENRRKNGNANV